ncbi:MAG: class II aldolase/adducin family protein [Candidatus Bathyarchaeia archaeon]
MRKTEKYVGTKFRTIFICREAPQDDRIRELIKWCQIFHELGLTPIVNGHSMGNLSFRVRKDRSEFIITASGIGPKNMLSQEFFVKVVNCDFENKIVYVCGLREPSSESMLHYRIYQLRNDVNAIFHGHNDEITKHAKEIEATETKEWHPYGTIELVKSVENVLSESNFIVIKQHGFLSLGRSMDEAGRRAVAMKKRVKEIIDTFHG